MKRSIWKFFIVSVIFWTIFAVWRAPELSGTDVFIFRDAGWNLAQYGHFESAGLVYQRDLAPHLYAHYTPLMPLLFAGFLKIAPVNAYVGTLFNLLWGFVSAALMIFCLQRVRESRLRNVLIWLCVVFPVVLVRQDRPEAVALPLVLLGSLYLMRRQPSWWMAGLLGAVIFLAHPYAGIIFVLWMVFFCAQRSRDDGQSWAQVILKLLRAAAVESFVIAAVALIFYLLDHESLKRFAAHALGIHSGLAVLEGTTSHHSMLGAMKMAMSADSRIWWIEYVVLLASLLVGMLLCMWNGRGSLQRILMPLFGLLSLIVTLGAFSTQGNYLIYLGFLLPIVLLLFYAEASFRLQAPLFLLLLVTFITHLLITATLPMLIGVERRESYESSMGQAAYLASHMQNRDAVVVVSGGEYDRYKPYFKHLVKLDNAQDVKDFSPVAAVANCYAGFQGEADAVRPLPELLNSNDFALIQRAPQHMWFTLAGRRMMRKQWGYGCDLYLRRNHEMD